MEKEFCNYQQSLKLKELGFNELCLFLYNSSDDNPKPFLANPPEPMDWNSLYVENTNKHLMSAPTFSAVFRWFREKYNLKSWIEEYTKNKYIYEIRPHKITDYKEGEIYVYATYEETELACLDKLIEIVEGIKDIK